MRFPFKIMSLAVLLGILGCRGGAMISQPASRAALDVGAIEAQAAQVLDFIDGRSDTPPSWTDPDDDKKSFWAGFRERRAFIADLKSKGCLVENNRGRLELRKCDDFGDAEDRNMAQRVMAEENKDRKTLYREVTHMHRDFGLSVTRVEQIYVMQRLLRAAPGETYQLPRESELIADLKKTDLGARLNNACQPGAWVIIP